MNGLMKRPVEHVLPRSERVEAQSLADVYQGLVVAHRVVQHDWRMLRGGPEAICTTTLGTLAPLEAHRRWCAARPLSTTAPPNAHNFNWHRGEFGGGFCAARAPRPIVT